MRLRNCCHGNCRSCDSLGDRGGLAGVWLRRGGRTWGLRGIFRPPWSDIRCSSALRENIASLTPPADIGRCWPLRSAIVCYCRQSCSETCHTPLQDNKRHTIQKLQRQLYARRSTVSPGSPAKAVVAV